MILRDYQKEAVIAIRDAFRRVRRCGFVLPTSGGKTAIFSHITSKLDEAGKSCLILVHRQELVRQTSNMLADLGVRHDIIAPVQLCYQIRAEQNYTHQKNFYDTTSNIKIASIQTLARRKVIDFHPVIIVVDECHHAVSKTWAELLDRFPRSKILGVTATPIRLDGKGLDKQFDELVIGKNIRWLVENDYIAEPIVYAKKIDLEGVKKKGSDFDVDDLDKKMSDGKIYGDAVKHYTKLCPNAPFIAFCINISHAVMSAKQFQEAGYKVHHIDGSMKPAQRKFLLDSLAKGKIHGLTSCDIISEGTDVPLVACIIGLRPTMSLSMYLQQIGRGLRKYPVGTDIMNEPHMQQFIANGKHNCIILDHAGNVERHGHPLVDRQWSLADGIMRQGEGKKKKKAEKPVHWQCAVPSCLTINPIENRICSNPACGAERGKKDIKVVDGELERVDFDPRPQWAGGLDIRIHPIREILQTARSMKDLYHIARVRGYKKGWAFHQAKIKGWINDGNDGQESETAQPRNIEIKNDAGITASIPYSVDREQPNW